jgi:Domain of unknown function (DUF6817)
MGIDVFKQLAELGADELQHINGSLLSHLEGTYGLLKAWGNREGLCKAGLYHAVYGTFAFESSLVDLKKRERIAVLIGPEAERIVYYYGACDRDYFYPRIGRLDEPNFLNRFTGQFENISKQMVGDLLELTLANELEIIKKDDAFLAERRVKYESLFDRFEPFVSAKGFEEYKRVFNKL